MKIAIRKVWSIASVLLILFTYLPIYLMTIRYAHEVIP